MTFPAWPNRSGSLVRGLGITSSSPRRADRAIFNSVSTSDTHVGRSDNEMITHHHFFRLPIQNSVMNLPT